MPCWAAQHASVSASFRGTQLSNRSRSGSARRATRAASSTRITAKLQEVTQDDWETEVLKEEGRMVLVDFWATWCGPCKLVLPSVEKIAVEYSDVLKVVKVEADPNPDLMSKYEVYGLPTLLLFKDGEEVPGSHWEGAINKAKLLAWLEKHGVAKV